MAVRRILSVLTLLLPVLLVAQEVTVDRMMRVGLLRDRTVRQVVVMSGKGSCAIYADGQKRGEVGAADGVKVTVVNGRLEARSLQLAITGVKQLELRPVLPSGYLRMRVPETKLAERSYQGTLLITPQTAALQLVNVVPLEAYTAGVVQAEAGKEHHQEYYKLQAVSCRTYALTNQRKHLPEGFELCDGVHCQVYHGRCKDDSIRMAVDATHSLVLVDSDIRIIHATFHSNCGGQTVNAEDLWSKHEPYLRATTDTFCLNAPHATWQKTLSRGEWLGYLQRRYGLGTSDSATLEAVLNYTPERRDLHLGNVSPAIPLKHVREDLKLRSTFFSVKSEGDKVVLSGRGFGHGVGLCQEGAMRMAKLGFSYTDILHHYYADVHLVEITTLDFFKDDRAAPPVAPPLGE
ncbi:MAG: SpoIID/LytB domain-containing protein [Flavobacteriales bacterium]|jgi:stage II sporulation protein D|nr:SpoIID/LytB domain-containing protein [Flavobacteriales bacterium]